MSMLGKVFGFLADSNEKAVNKLQPLVDEISALEPEWEKLSDDALKAKTQEFKAAIQDGEELVGRRVTACASQRKSAPAPCSLPRPRSLARAESRSCTPRTLATHSNSVGTRSSPQPSIVY